MLAGSSLVALGIPALVVRLEGAGRRCGEPTGVGVLLRMLGLAAGGLGGRLPTMPRMPAQLRVTLGKVQGHPVREASELVRWPLLVDAGRRAVALNM